jgi:hypothetical protein
VTHCGIDIKNTHLSRINDSPNVFNFCAIEVAIELAVLKEFAVHDVRLHGDSVFKEITLAMHFLVPWGS